MPHPTRRSGRLSAHSGRRPACIISFRKFRRICMGTLYVVATPIGNLEDVTLRALRVLREVSIVAAEDTRRTARLLQHYGIATPTIAFHEHSGPARVRLLIERLVAGESVAVVSDAGTPGVSDPGYELIRAAREHQDRKST